MATFMTPGRFGVLGIVTLAAVVGACSATLDPTGAGNSDGGSWADAAGGDGATVTDGASGDGMSPGSDAAGDGAADGAASVDAGDGGPVFDPGVCQSFAWDGVYTLPDGDVCSIHGACLDNPSALMAPLLYVWTPQAGEAWFADSTIVVHYAGGKVSGLTALPAGSGGPIYGSGANDVWIGSLHWDGATLTLDAAHRPPGRAWFASKTDAWAVHGQKMAHWDGATWTDVATPAVFALSGVFGFATDDVYAVGGPGLFHWDGASWSATAVALPAGGTGSEVWGRSGADLWVGGDKLYRFDGAAFTPYVTGGAVSSMSGSTTEVHFLVKGTAMRWNGGAGAEPGMNTICMSCGTCTAAATVPGTGGERYYATSLGSMSAVTPGGCPMFRRNAGDIDSLNLGANQFPGTFTSPLLPKSTGEILMIVGSTLKQKMVSATYVPVAWGITNDDVAVGLSGNADDDIWVSGYYAAANMAAHWDGAAWTTSALPARPTSAVHAASPTSAWVLTGKSSAYFDGLTWTAKGPVTAGEVRAIWGAGPNDALAVGDDAYHWDGITWTKLNSGFTDFVAVGGLLPSRVTLVRDYGRIVFWDGAALFPWSGMPPSTTPATKLSSFAFRGDEVWATNKTLQSPYSTPQAHVWRFEGGCWRSPSDGTLLQAFPYVGAMGDRVVASDGNRWLSVKP